MASSIFATSWPLRGLRKLDPQGGTVGLRGVDALHLLDRLQPALRPRGGGGVGAVAIDEVLHLADLLLLRVERRLVHRQPVLFLRDVGRVVARIRVKLAELQLKGLGDHAIEEVAVVTGDQDGARIGAEKLLEPLHTQQVEVVRRLVEQQQVVLEGQQSAQGQAHRPAAGEGGHRRVESARSRTPGPARSPWPRSFHLVASAGREEGLVRIVVVGQRLRVALLESLHDHLQPAVGHGPGPEVAEHVLEDGPVVERVDLLRQVARRAFPVAKHLARIERFLVHQDLEQRCLARAILAEQADAVAAIDRGIDAVVQRLPAVVLARVDKSDHGGGILGRGG